MEGVQNLQNAGILDVKRLAGTSAGAIVGSLFAAGVSIEGFRKELIGGLGEKLKTRFQPPSKWSIGNAVLRGMPFWDESLLKKELDRIFKEKNCSKVMDLKEPEMLIVASDLENGGASIAKGGEFISNALIDSVGIPFCFRGWRAPKPSIVDGGICNNFPWEELSKNDAKIAGISFVPTRPQLGQGKRLFSNVVAFAKSLLDTSIDAAMEQARIRLKAESIFLIKPELDTFDFEGCLRYLRSESYGTLREHAEAFFRDFVKEKPSHIVVKWDEENLSMMTKLNRIYKVQHEKYNVDYRHCSVEVEANSLGDEPNKPDVVTYVTKFFTLKDRIQCLRIALQGNPREPLDETRTTWRAFSPDGSVIDIIGLPMKDPESNDLRELMLFFSPELQPNTGAYTLTFQDTVRGAMAPLRIDGKDFIVFSPSRAVGPVARIDLVLYVPKVFGKVVMQRENGVGRQMVVPELRDYKAPFGFDPYGWTGTDLPNNQDFTVKVVVPGYNEDST